MTPTTTKAIADCPGAKNMHLDSQATNEQAIECPDGEFSHLDTNKKAGIWKKRPEGEWSFTYVGRGRDGRVYPRKRFIQQVQILDLLEVQGENLTDRAAARLIGCSPTTVGKMRLVLLSGKAEEIRTRAIKNWEGTSKLQRVKQFTRHLSLKDLLELLAFIKQEISLHKEAMACL